jgi:CheY-like chemotaxis protein
MLASISMSTSEGSVAPGERMIRLDGLRVLVVDNEEDTLALVSEVLQMHGAEVASALSVKDALTHLELSLPDVIVSDIGMPFEDGYSFIRRLRAMPPARGGAIPAIALTAYAAVTDARQALEAGFQLHVRKPVELAQLVVFVAQLGRPTAPPP